MNTQSPFSFTRFPLTLTLATLLALASGCGGADPGPSARESTAPAASATRGSPAEAPPPDDAGPADDAASPRHCGGNSTDAPTCPAGEDCVPYPNSRIPFGDVGGLCAAACASDADCSAGEACAFLARDACEAKGHCFAPALVAVPATSPPPTCCTCAGSTVTGDGCGATKELYGYAPWPIHVAGACP